MENNSALSLHNISLRYGGLEILKKVSFDVAHNEVIGLIGPNGAGKSALLNCISRVYHPDSQSRITVLGEKNFLDVPQHAIAKHGVSRTFQGLQLSRSLTVFQNIAVGFSSKLRYNALDSLLRPLLFLREERSLKTKVQDVAQSCGISEVLHKYPNELPLGVLRRVDLARALVSSPSVLLLDEPASGLSREERPLIAELIRVAREHHHVSVIWVEHDLDLVFSESKRVVVLRNGAVTAVGKPDIPQERTALLSAYYN